MKMSMPCSRAVRYLGLALLLSGCGVSAPANPLIDLTQYALQDEMPADAEDTGVPVAAATGEVPSQPNLILIMTDDQAMADLAAMPDVLRLLREEGVAFARSFASWPLCCPSRATAFTGQYAHNHGVLGNTPPEGSHSAFTTDSETLPVWLQRAGYRTTHIGKYLNGYGADSRGSTYIPPGWDQWQGLVDPSTYGMWGYTVNRDGVLQTYGDLNDEDPALYQTDVLRELALDSITASAQTGQPFFLSVAFLAPHEELAEAAGEGGAHPGPRPAPRHAGLFAAAQVPEPLSFYEADTSDKPAVVQALARAGSRETAEGLALRFRRRLESLRAVDEAVAAIVAHLAALGVLERTYIVFTSDNGWFNGEHGLPGGKRLMYEPSVRVPLLMRGPGLSVGTSQEPVANVDLTPTFLELADATAAGRVIDGRSLLPYARDLALRSERPIVLESPIRQQIGGGAELPAMRGLRTRQWSYVEYDTGEVELYDLVRDPGQLQSLHDDPAEQARRTEFHEALSQYASCAGDSCRAELMAP